MSRATRLINSLFRALTRLGLGASYRHILTVPGRKTGRLYSTPVDVLELDGQRWLVAGYGPASWVANARAAGEVTLSRGGRNQRLRSRGNCADRRGRGAPQIHHRDPRHPSLLRRWPLVPSPDEEIAAELPRQPVFHLAPR
jgi:deazaflavin-dependent oxidoreductase (nitroreductase family)